MKSRWYVLIALVIGFTVVLPGVIYKKSMKSRVVSPAHVHMVTVRPAAPTADSGVSFVRDLSHMKVWDLSSVPRQRFQFRSKRNL